VVQLEDDWHEPALLQKSPAGQPLSLRHLQEPDAWSQALLAGQELGLLTSQTHRLATVSWMKPAGQHASPEQIQARTEAL